MTILAKVVSHWADKVLAAHVLRLEAALDAEKRRLAVSEIEVGIMAAALARDRQRIKAEGACYARQQADAEGVANERRDHQGPG